MVEFQSLYSIPCIRGRVPVDPELVADYLWEATQNPKNRKHPDSEHIMYQDFHIPDNVKEESPHTFECVNYIENALKEATNADIIDSSWPWCIVNGKNEQIYPHHHNDGDGRWSAVYWAQVPEGSGNLEFYPTGHIAEPCVSVEPKAGDFLIWPAWVLHGVRHNVSDRDRISMSFNLDEYKNPWPHTQL